MHLSGSRRLDGSLRWLALFVAACAGGPKPSGQDFNTIRVDEEPQQEPVGSDTSVEYVLPNGGLILKLPYRYHIAARVVCKAEFSSGWAGQTAPFDLTLVWGDLAQDRLRKHIAYTHLGRWYHYHYKAGCPVSSDYIIAHSANCHIIPANDYIRGAVKRIRVGDRIALDGFLVRLEGAVKGERCRWYSSITRTDSGDGSCELIYVSRVQIGTDVYERAP